jgi:hypothetical protein
MVPDPKSESCIKGDFTIVLGCFITSGFAGDINARELAGFQVMGAIRKAGPA